MIRLLHPEHLGALCTHGGERDIRFRPNVQQKIKQLYDYMNNNLSDFSYPAHTTPNLLAFILKPARTARFFFFFGNKLATLAQCGKVTFIVNETQQTGLRGSRDWSSIFDFPLLLDSPHIKGMNPVAVVVIGGAG